MSQYFAPYGRENMLLMGEYISQRHLTYQDRLIGIIGRAGSGKSSLIRGMFPGLELSNDDDTLNPRKIMQVRADMLEHVQQTTTHHIDMRFQTAFTQMFEIVDFVNSALSKNKRVIVEHFELLYPALGVNADLLIGVGEEIIVTRPSVFGPSPQSISDIVGKSLSYRRMGHSMEDIITTILSQELGVPQTVFFSGNMRNGVVLKFSAKPELDIAELEKRVRKLVNEHVDIGYYDENHVQIGDKVIECDGPRLHVRNTSEISDFVFLPELVWDTQTNAYCLVVLFDETAEDLDIHNINTTHFLMRD